MAKWWNQEVGAAAQGMYDNPWMALNSTMIPSALIPPDQRPAGGSAPTAEKLGMTEDEFNRYVNINQDGSWSVSKNMDGSSREKGFMGFVKGVAGDMIYGVKQGFGAVEKAAHAVPVVSQLWDANKWFVKNAMIQPIDKIASGAYWAYGEAVSQPLTTAILQMGKFQQQGVNALMPGELAESYRQAEHISPGQALTNVGATMGRSPLETLVRAQLAVPTFGMSMVIQPNEMDRQYTNDRYLYDTEFWRKQNGWKYDLGTGLLDAQSSMYLDPTIGIGKGIKVASGATRAVKLVEGEQHALGGFIHRSSKDLTNDKKFTDFANHAIENNWSPEQIRIAMERGRGSRYSAFTSRDMGGQLSEALAQAKTVEDWQMAARFAMGDTEAFAELAQRNQAFALAYGKALDHKVNVTNVDKIYRNSYNGMIENGFQARAIKPARYEGAVTPTERPFGPMEKDWEFSPRTSRPVEERVKVDEQGNLFNFAPYVRSSDQVAVELGEDAAKPWEQLAFEGKGFKYEVKPLDPESLPGTYFNNIQIPGLVEWRAGIESTLNANATQLKALSDENQWISILMQDDRTPALNPLFGSMKEARFAGVGRNIIKQGERRQVQYLGVRETDGFQSRLLQNGIYGATVRFIGKMGDRLPTGVINHNMGDASSNLAAYLKAAPIEGGNVAQLVNDYSRLANKADSGKYIEDVIMPMVFEGFGKKYNLDLETVQNLYANAVGIRGQEINKLKNPQMSFTAATVPGPNGQPIRIDQMLDGERVAAHPKFITQLQYTSFLPNLKKLDRFFAKNGGTISRMRKAGISSYDVIDNFMGTYNQIFKFGNLFRIAYPVRSVTEETAARSAKFGALSVLADTASGSAAILRKVKPLAAIVDASGRKVRSVEVNNSLPMVQEMGTRLDEHIAFLESEIARRQNPPVWAGEQHQIDDEAIKFLQDRIDNANATKSEFASYERELINHSLREHTATGEGTFMYRGQAHPEPFNEAYAGAIPRDQITSSHSWESVFGRIESFAKEDMIRSGNWKTLTPVDPGHLESWERAVNLQILQDPVGIRMVQDPTGNEALLFLRSPEGAIYRRDLGVAGGADPTDHVQLVKNIVDQYIPDAIREQAAKNGKVAANDFKAIPEMERPPVHGEEIRLALGGDGGAHAWVDRAIEKWFNGAIVRGSSDRLSWQPTYVRAHRMHYQELVDKHYASMEKLGTPREFLTTEEINKFMQQADKSARSTMREILYEPTRTNLSNALRNISPFFSAHTDSLARWGGMIVENPDLIGKMAKIYNAPVAANLVTDRNGNKVEAGGLDKDGNLVEMSDRVINFQINPYTKNLPGGIKDMRIGVGSLNVITPGEPWWNPGFGPVVSIPADSVMRNIPASAELLGWINPYGTSAESAPEEFLTSLTPSYIDTLIQGWDEDGQKFQDSVMASYRAQMVDFHQGGRSKAPDWKEAQSDAKRLYWLNALADGILPGKTREMDKYQFYVDAYKSIQQEDATHARDIFMSRYGKDFKEYSDALAFTVASSKSKSGIPATVEGLAKSEEFGHLIHENPELGGFIVGDPARSGEFNEWVLLAQKASGDRTTVSAEDRIRQAQISAGWDMYTKVAEAIRADMTQRGLTSLSQKGAEDLAAKKQLAVYKIAGKYEAWADDYTTTDRDSVPKRIAAMAQIVNDQRLANDPNRTDIQAMRAYLAKRAQFMGILAQRDAAGGSASLTATSNRDLYLAWESTREAIAEKDTKFSPTMERYLSQDMLQSSIIKNPMEKLSASNR